MGFCVRPASEPGRRPALIKVVLSRRQAGEGWSLAARTPSDHYMTHQSPSGVRAPPIDGQLWATKLVRSLALKPFTTAALAVPEHKPCTSIINVSLLGKLVCHLCLLRMWIVCIWRCGYGVCVPTSFACSTKTTNGYSRGHVSVAKPST